MIGTSLAGTGLIDPARYVDEVALLARGWNAERYYAHRREPPEKLRMLAEQSEMDIVRPELPLELELLRGPVAECLISLPSLVQHTLPFVPAGAGVEIMVCAYGTGWLSRTRPSGQAGLHPVVNARSGCCSPVSATSPSAG